jgi:hypothetical protein
MGGRQNTRTNIEMKGGAIFENYSTAPLIQMISVCFTLSLQQPSLQTLDTQGLPVTFKNKDVYFTVLCSSYIEVTLNN